MNCRLGCGACCIAPSITTSIPGMPDGKPAGVRCIQLDDNNLCKLFGQAERPAVCGLFAATEDVCGKTDTEALWLISSLETATSA
ncbi:MULTISPECIES: YkgJ family cysteine cluster protein [unclassified Shewanella]|uniref:YkgJ family cysteine cluster protein n=1 Tax=unclassified Shewanella TaxID=196818 RepID=UPI001C7FC5EE|nr:MULTISPECIES: YkgJ family cysteine cluster protein [unclassified Shewanella]MCG9729116.1 YkgJ family cysteine cluster protein [Shewanella sp. Isolate13]